MYSPGRLPRRATLGLFLLAGCGAMPPVETVTLPPQGWPPGAGDPTRAAILASAQAFAEPASVAGNPAAVADTLWQLEYLTVELAFGAQWRDMDPLAVTELRLGRAEARAAFGFRPDAPAQVAVNALLGCATALHNENRAAAATALAPLVPPGQEAATLARLNALPVLPRAAQGTNLARISLNRSGDSGRGRRLR